MKPFRRLRLLAATVIVGVAVTGCATAPQQPVGTPSQAANKLAELHTQLGIGYLRDGKLDLAWKRLHRALEADPDYSAAHNAMALLYERMKETAKADEHFRRAVELDPVNSSAQNNYGSFLCSTGHPEEGEQRFLQAVKNPLYRSPQTAYANAGLCMLRAGKRERAESYLRSALAIDARMPVALFSMAEISFDKHNALSARAYLQRYLETSPHTAATLWLGIRIERELGDKDTESSYALLLRSRFTGSPEADLLRRSDTQ